MENNPTPKQKKPRRLSKKQLGFVKDYVETGNGTQSVLKNYDTKDYKVAGVIAVENLAKPSIINAIKSIADSISDDVLIEVHNEGLKAVNGDKPDYAVRHKYLDSAYKLKGTYAPDKAVTVNMNVTADAKTLAIAKKYEEEIKQGL